MIKPTQILDDTRKIKGLVMDTFSHEVGRDGVEEIVAYGEPGEFCDLPWFALYYKGQICRRINAITIFAVDYVEKKEEPKS